MSAGLAAAEAPERRVRIQGTNRRVCMKGGQRLIVPLGAEAPQRNRPDLRRAIIRIATLQVRGCLPLYAFG